jgi:hypothetical protein
MSPRIVDLAGSFSNGARKKNARIEIRLGHFLKFYPTGAVQVNLPFPFVKGRMTVAAEADFQRRHAIFRNNQASSVHQLSVRGLRLNREHRRANSKAAG